MLDLNGSNILLTGGTGSFGNAFVERVIDCWPDATVRVYSRDELKQSQMRDRFGDRQVRYLIGDVRARSRMTPAVRGARIVVPPAAITRVPAHEYTPTATARTAAGMGAAIAGMLPVLIHHRLDFMIYSMDAIVNWLSLWRFKSNSGSGVPLVIRAIVGKGWGQGPQHSKSLHAWFAHVPGLKVVMPATPYDAKGLLIAAIRDDNPVVFLPDRWLNGAVGDVPEEMFEVPIGQAAIRRSGTEV